MGTPPGNVVRAVFTATNVGGEKINTGCWFFLNTSAPTQTDLDNQTTDIATLWNTFTATMIGDVYAGVSWQILNTYYYAGGSNNASLQSSHTLTANTGTRSTAGSPIDTCCVVTLLTGFPGRSRRGRMYLPCHDTITATTGNFPSSTPVTYASGIGAFFNSYSSAHPGWGAVVSRTLGDSLPITLVRVNSLPDVQRRRENKLAINSTSQTVVTP